MARQSINVNPTVREFEAYMDFSGGINTETSNERLLDNEFAEMINVNLKNRGTVKKRTGFKTVTSVLPSSNSVLQGMFFFYREDESKPDIIFAKQGKLFVKEYDTDVVSEITMTNLTDPSTNQPISNFQNSKIVEGVQFLDKMYVASGSGIIVIEYNKTATIKWSAKGITPYEPVSQELKFIGTNALLPYAMQDSVISNQTINAFYIKGITFTQVSSSKLMRVGKLNSQIQIDAFIAHNPSLSGYNQNLNTYEFYYKKQGNTKRVSENIVVQVPNSQSEFVLEKETSQKTFYEPGSLRVYVDNVEVINFEEYADYNGFKISPAVDASSKPVVVTASYIPSWRKTTTSDASYTTNTPNTTKNIKIIPRTVGFFDFKVVAYFNGNVKEEFLFENFQVKEALEKNDLYDQPTSGIRTCNRIRLHFNRLLLFGDNSEPTQIYFSHLDNPSYFPAVNTFRFDTGKKEPITTIERIQNYLAVFTKTTIYTITGTSPSDYSINLINDSVGCIAERSAVLTGNVVTFLSQEGVFALKPSNFKLDQLNVQRVDTKIKSQIPKDTNACAISYDSQYFLCFPDKKIIYRYYYEQGAWVKDTSDALSFNQFLIYSDELYAIQKNGNLLSKDNSVYTDGNTSYDMVVETKYFDLSKSFNFKKLKKLYILGKHYDTYDSEYKVKVYADAAIILDPEVGYAYVDTDSNGIDYVYWDVKNNPNIEFHQATVFGDWVLGEDILGGNYLDVQKARIRGKCRRVKVQFVNSQPSECELFGFGLEFKLKKP